MPGPYSTDFLNRLGLGEGLVTPPTDELFLRQQRSNPDPTITSHPVDPGDSYSSARSFSVGTDAGERVMPQVVNGFVLPQQDAINWSNKTGRHFGIYDTPEHGDAAGQRLHELQALHDDLLRVGSQRSSSMRDALVAALSQSGGK
jgi:hypothetical protein